MQRRLLDILGVLAASTGLQLPDRGGPVISDVAPFFEVGGRPVPADQRQRATIVVTRPGYLRALGIPLIQGREFEQRDMRGTAHVAIINESLARTYFANADPIGKRLKLDSWRLSEPRVQEIVGVAADVTHNTVESAQPVVYVPSTDGDDRRDLLLGLLSTDFRKYGTYRRQHGDDTKARRHSEKPASNEPWSAGFSLGFRAFVSSRCCPRYVAVLPKCST